jgi:hypothetical protein
MKFHIKKCTVYQNNENSNANNAATGFPCDFEAARKVHKKPSDAKGAVL